jgi:hypothetical protein
MAMGSGANHAQSLLRASSPDACSSQLQFSGVMEQLSKTDATCRPSKMSYSGQSTRRLSSTRQKAASLTRRTSFICGYCSLTKDGHARGSRLVGLAENAVQHRKLRGPSLSASTPNSSAQPATAATAGSPIPQPLIDPEPAKPLPAGAPPVGYHWPQLATGRFVRGMAGPAGLAGRDLIWRCLCLRRIEGKRRTCDQDRPCDRRCAHNHPLHITV